MQQTTTSFWKLGLVAAACAALAACGGGDASGNNSGNGSSATIALSGQVKDGPIQGAQVCLYANGTLAQNPNNTAICSSATDGNGNYTLQIPANLSGLLTLIASKSGGIQLASILGTIATVQAAASQGQVSASSLPSLQVTHFTTADFALADTDGDGTVSQSERDAYKPDFARVQQAATAIKAVIDFGRSELLGGNIANTRQLAAAVGKGKPAGNGQTFDQWLATAPVVAQLQEAIRNDVGGSLSGKFAKYQLTTNTTARNIPPTVTTQYNGVTASIYCWADNLGTVQRPAEIALDAARGVVVLKTMNDTNELLYITGNYDAQTGNFTLNDNTPKSVSLVSGGVTFYGEENFVTTGKVDGSGNLSGTFNFAVATTWSIDATRQECTASGTIMATKAP